MGGTVNMGGTINMGGKVLYTVIHLYNSCTQYSTECLFFIVLCIVIH